MSKKRVTLIEFYKKYNYPCWDTSLLKEEKRIVPLPYIPIKDLKCDHKFSLKYSEWLDIMQVYLEEFFNVLYEGIEVNLPLMLGKWQLQKYKSNKQFNINYVKLKNENILEEDMRRNPLINDYSVKLRWKKGHKYTKFQFNGHWSVNLIRGRWHKLYAKLDENPSDIFNFTE